MLKLNKNNLIKNSNLMTQFAQIEAEFSVLALSEILKLLNVYKNKLDRNVNLTLLADSLLLQILEVKFLCK